MIIILENTQQTNAKGGGIFLDRENTLQDTNVIASRDTVNNQPISPVHIVIIGAAIIFIGAVIYITKIFCNKRSKRKKDLEDSNMEISPITEMEPLPKKTAADHIEELKERAQKALQPLKLGSSGSSLSEERGSNNSNINSQISSKSQVELRPRSQLISTPRIGSRNSLSPKKSPSPLPLLPSLPSPPPPTPLKYQYDDIETDPIQMSLLDALLLDYITPPSTINTSSRSSRRKSIANSRTLSSLPSRAPIEISRASRERLNHKRSKQNIPKYSKSEDNFAKLQDIKAIQIAQSEKITPTETEVHSSNSS